MALLDDVKTVLITASVGVTDTSSEDEWAIHLGRMPDDQSQVISIVELPGGQPETVWQVDYPSFQIHVRGKPYEYDIARTKIQAVFNALHNEDSTTSPGTFPGTAYINVLGATSGPIALGEDEHFRPVLAWTFNVIKHR